MQCYSYYLNKKRSNLGLLIPFDQLIQQIASACEILIHHTLVQYKKYGLERSKLEPKAINHENLVKSDLMMCIFDYNLFIKV